MCIDCGCSDGATATMTNVKSGEISDIRHDAGGRLHDSAHQHSHGHDHDHHHGHHHHGHTHSHGHAGVIDLQQSLLEKNDALAKS